MAVFISKSKLSCQDSSSKPDSKNQISRSSLMILTAAAFWGWHVHGAFGATETWTAVSGDWSTAANWNGGSGHVPSSGDTVNIINGDGTARTITYDYAGPAVSLNSLTIDLTGSASASTLSIAANNLTVNNNETVGQNGNGAVEQSGGTVSIGGTLYLAHTTGSSGSYTLSGGMLTVSGTTFVGFSSGAGSLTVSGDGILNADGGLFDQGSLTLAGGTINASGFGCYTPSLFHWTAGSFNINNDVVIDSNTFPSFGSSLSIGAGQSLSVNDETIGATGSGMLNQTGGTNTVRSAFYVGANDANVGENTGMSGTYSLSGSGALSASTEYIGFNGIGTVTQTGGVNDCTYELLMGVYGGSVTPTGTYNLESGSLSVAADEIVGLMGNGNFNQRGGTQTIGADLDIAEENGSTASYQVQGGSLQVGGSLVIGSSSPSGVGTLTISSTGLVTIAKTLQVYNKAGNSLNLSGGVLSAAAVNLSGNPSLFNWTGGTLLIEGNGSSFGGTLSVPNGGTLGGIGVITDPVSVALGGTIAPGDGTGILSTGSIALSPDATLVSLIDGTAVGSYDELSVTGTVSIGGANLDVVLGYAPSIGDSWTIISNNGTSPVFGTFAQLPQGADLAVLDPLGRTDLLQVSYSAVDGNDVILTTVAVPEPTSGALLCVGVGLLIRRRR
jgi:fibronectin-binding autotransporter adhesin